MTTDKRIAPWLAELSNADVTIPFTLIACENADGELLMLKRSKPPFVGMWNFVGGKIEQDEFPHTSAQRELLEELGYAVAPRLLKYRGVAFWPELSEIGTQYKGMHLFHAKLPLKRHSTGQLALLDEGIIAWLPKDFLSEGDRFRAVPNFNLLYPVMVGARDVGPQAMFHWPDSHARYQAYTAPIRGAYVRPSSFPPGMGQIPINALADFAP